MQTTDANRLRVAVAQIAPVVLDRAATLQKVCEHVRDAAQAGARLVVFGEALVPGYPYWLDRADGARFESPEQKAIHARYVDQAVRIDHGQLDDVCRLAREHRIACSLGVIERPADRGASLFCSSVFIDSSGRIASVHRKLMPTFEERLSWAHGDGAGLVTHAVPPFQVGALLCWENWMPLARAALQGAGETLHIAHWPGGEHNTRPITRFLAREGRSFCISASCLTRGADLPSDLPARARISSDPDELLGDGGSCIAGPDGEWVLEPCVGREELLLADLELSQVLRERQNFDPSGHYARPDVLRLTVDRTRRATVRFVDTPTPQDDGPT